MRKIAVWTLTGVGIVLVVLGVLYVIAVGVSAAKLRNAYAMLEEAGRPMDTSHVIPPPVPDAENAATLYQSAILLLKAQPAPEKNLFEYVARLCSEFVREGLDDDKRAELAQLLDRDVVGRALFAIEQGTRRSSCYFERDYSEGVHLRMPHLEEMRDLGYLVAAKARIEGEVGRTDAAWGWARAQLESADALRSEPVLVGQLVRGAMLRLSCDTIQELCAIAPPGDARSRELEDVLHDLDGMDPLISAMDGQRLLFGKWTFELPNEELLRVFVEEALGDGAPRLLGWLKYKVVTFKPLFLADQAAYLRLMAKGTQDLGRPYSRGRAKALDREARRHILTSYVIPTISHVNETYRRALARLRITSAGLALLRYKEAHGTFPAALDAVQPGNVTDPFSEEPLKYERRLAGFVLYSVGEDQRDNGGVGKEPERETDYDIVWHFGAN